MILSIVTIDKIYLAESLWLYGTGLLSKPIMVVLTLERGQNGVRPRFVALPQLALFYSVNFAT